MSKTTMSKNEIEQKIRDLKTKLSCQESDIGDWKIAKCIEYSTLGMESPYDLQELHKQRQVIRDEIGALEEELAKCEDEDALLLLYLPFSSSSLIVVFNGECHLCLILTFCKEIRERHHISILINECHLTDECTNKLIFLKLDGVLIGCI